MRRRTNNVAALHRGQVQIAAHQMRIVARQDHDFAAADHEFFAVAIFDSDAKLALDDVVIHDQV